MMSNVELVVAVPVNYGMLSYHASKTLNSYTDSRSPRQLWNALLQSRLN